MRMRFRRPMIASALLIPSLAGCEKAAAPAGDEIRTGTVVSTQSGGLEALDSTIARLEQAVRDPQAHTFSAQAGGKPQTLETILADLYATRERLRAEQAGDTR
jgi:hypothetical protein